MRCRATRCGTRVRNNQKGESRHHEQLSTPKPEPSPAPTPTVARRRTERPGPVYTHFLLKGLAKVRTEWSLITLVYNLKRVLNLVNFQKLMSAVG